MSYTISDGLRDREYNKFISPQNGSNASVATNAVDRIKKYTFTRAECTATGGTESGLFNAYTSEPLNGILRAIAVEHNDFTANGSLFLFTSGFGNVEVWKIISGTATSNVGVIGQYIPRAMARSTDNTNLSGTNAAGMMAEIPLWGTFRLVGSGLGDAKTCSGVTIVYG